MDNSRFEGLKVRRLWPICTWYRLALCDVLSKDIHRVLYLDADTVVAENLSHLFNLDMDNKSIAAVIDDYAVIGRATRLGYEESKGYVCSGIILMNLDYWRQHGFSEKSLDWARTHPDELSYPDQDALNVVCQDSKIILPLNYATNSHFFQHELIYCDHLAELKACVEHPIIIHYTVKAWIKETAQLNLFSNIWEHYNRRLRHPVRVTYESKGFLRFKIQVWRLLHPFNRRCQSILEIKDKIALYERNTV
jgi:lipopolysaccharide biosynthesis glycosyltransferase